MSYSEFIKKPRSSKVILAHLEAKERLTLFSIYSGATYVRDISHYVKEVKVNGSYLEEASDKDSLLPGQYFYAPIEGKLYIRTINDTEPKKNSIFVTYIFFFSNTGANLPAFITSGDIVHYDARVKSIGSLKLELDYENTGIALETNSSIGLENNDAYFDDLFDVLIWENNSVKFWSWSNSLPASEAKLIYKGIITDKSFSPAEIKFNLKDELSKLRAPLNWSRFSELDGDIEDSLVNKPKRLVFGRVDKLRTVGIDKTLNGFTLTGLITGDADRNLLDGTVSGLAGQNTVNGAGTLFTTQLSPGDQIRIIDVFNEYTYTVNSITSNTQLVISGTISASFNMAAIRNLEVENNILEGVGTSFISEVSPGDIIKATVSQVEYEYGVLEVVSDTQLILEDEIEAGFSNSTLINSPAIPYRRKNRRWHIAGHELREYSVNITSIIDATNIEVDDINDMQEGDYVTINGLQYIIARISNNKVRLNQALRSATIVGDLVTKIPVQRVYVGNQAFIINRDYTVSNGATDSILEFNDLAEFNVAIPKNPAIQFNLVAGSRIVTTSSTDVDLTQVFSPRDWIRAKSISTPEWYEILDVEQQQITLRTPSLITFSGAIQYKNPSYISDDSLVTVDCLGLQSSGSWVRYPSSVVKWLLEEAGLDQLNAASFSEAEADATMTMALYYPSSIGQEMPVIRDMITDVNKSVFGSLYLDNSFNYTYKILNADRPEDLEAVRDEDILGFNVTTKSNIFNSIILSYSPYVDIESGSESFKTILLESDFVNEAVEREEQLRVTSYLYSEEDAQLIAERWLFFRSLTQTVVTINSKLNFSEKTLNDAILLDLERLYKRFGSSTRRKIGLINSISKNGTDNVIQINDLGNVFSRVPSIAPDTEGDYLAGSESVDRYGFILDNDTETPNPASELELGTNLIG